ncbi:HAD-IA family hydrolase [Micrococcus lylae]|uniref:HAD-IA family hydrolase n=1 Tax=Micrococcus lylae TaxID=1273 RepID=UPI0021A68A95|nr:HAD-IA family hydrolase [Micrococcus lylae]MCT2008402.1 HAD-IA family hydrolase [Micrococcus lylae]MCT2072299.1 HAD-IA family hydrolase [Micrococcus lylae]
MTTQPLPPRRAHAEPRPLPVPLRLAVVDMSGTSIVDTGLQDTAFAEALDTHGVGEGHPERTFHLAAFRRRRRSSRTDVFSSIFGDRATARSAVRTFEERLDALIAEHGARPQPGAVEALERLREQGMALCLATGFARHTQNTLLESLDWMGLADLSLSPDDVGRGVPYPDMVLTALLALDLEDVRSVLTVGDTDADVQAGRRAGAGLVVGVLSGEDDGDALAAAGADAVLPLLADVPELTERLARA